MSRVGKSTFDKLVDKATSQLLLDPDWDSILQICDAIRQGDVQPKYAMSTLRRKIYSENPHIATYALQTLESIVKNCGSIMHEEVATKDFMEFMKELVKIRSDPVKAKTLELIQVWSHAFRNEPSYKIVPDTYNLMKLEGYTFPTLNESDSMFSAEKAPEWKEGETCYKCASSFGMVTRKHHCRNCGQIFCAKCSSKESIIPKYGYEREVRVCDPCYDELNKGSCSAGKTKSDDALPTEYLSSPLSQQSQGPPKKTEEELQEEEELQLAIALSQSEAENKAKEKMRLTSAYGRGSLGSTSPGPAITAQVSAPSFDASEMDPELARYLNRNYWQQREQEMKVVPQSTTTPSAPVATTEPISTMVPRVQEQYQNGVMSAESDADQTQFLNALNGSLEIFVNRMKSNSSRGRHISNDSSVQTLFLTLSKMHPELMTHIQEQEESRAHYESLQDKLAQLKDAREALNALREDQKEKRRREAEEQERQRQIQMARKLDVMRQKKQEYLEYQRQLALQRMQEQEREMAMRFEQQRTMTQIRQMQSYSNPYQQTYPNVPQGYGQASKVENPPAHHAQPPQHQQGMYGEMVPHSMGQVPPGSLGGVPGQQIGGQPVGANITAPLPGSGQFVGPPPQAMYNQGAPQIIPPGAPAPNQGAALPPQAGNVPPQGGPNSLAGPPQSQVYTQGYQPPTTSYPSGGFPGYPPGQVYPGGPAPGPPATVPGGAPPHGYGSPQTSMDYNAYNMQGMASSLPTGQPGGQYIPAGVTNQYQPNPTQPQEQQAPPPSQIQPRIPPQQDAQLISFD